MVCSDIFWSGQIGNLGRVNISAQTGKKEKKLFSVLLGFYPPVSPRGQFINQL